MNRRDALMAMAAALGASLSLPRLLAATLELPAAGRPFGGFTAADIALLDEIGDTILPPTDVPGAKAAGIGRFIAMMITDCYEPADQAAFTAGLAGFSPGYQAKYQEAFLAGAPANRLEFLNGLDRALATQPKDATAPLHYFRLLRELTLLGYFTSEIGATQALEYLEVPGRYDGNAPYNPGDRAPAAPVF